jgi:hypothetical protein
MELPPLPPKLPVLPALHMQELGRIKRASTPVTILEHVGRQPRVLAAEDIPGYWEFRGWLRAQQQLSDEGTLMTYPVGHARLAAVEARRIANESLPFTRIGPTVPLLPPLPPRLPCLPK